MTRLGDPIKSDQENNSKEDKNLKNKISDSQEALRYNYKVNYIKYKRLLMVVAKNEQYSVQAETLMKAAIEDYLELIKEIQASNANMKLIKSIKITVNGKPRRLVDVGDLKTGESENQLILLVFNTDHVELLLDQMLSYNLNHQLMVNSLKLTFLIQAINN